MPTKMLIAGAVLLVQCARLVLGQATYACGGPLAQPCVPTVSGTSTSTANNIECDDWEAKGWYRSDLKPSLWTERGIDVWFVKFIAEHPKLKTPSPDGFYNDFAKAVGHRWKRPCNTLQLCEIEKGIPDNCATTDNLNGYLVLKAMENLNNYFYVQDRTGEKAYTLLTNEIPSIRKDLKPSKTQESFKEPEPKKWVQMGAKVLGSIPEVGAYIGGAITVLGEIYISEPLKNVDTDLSNVQNNFKNIILALDKRLQATFQAAFNGDPTAAGGAIAVLKGGAFLRSFSVEFSNTDTIKMSMYNTIKSVFVNMLLQYYQIWANAAQYSHIYACQGFMKDIGWNLAGEKCLTRVDPGSNFRGVHVFLVNYERNVFKSQRAELEYDQAPALEKYINVNQMYWESIACDLDPTQCSKGLFDIPVIRYDRCLNLVWTRGYGLMATNGRWQRSTEIKDLSYRRQSIYCTHHINGLLQGLASLANSDCVMTNPMPRYPYWLGESSLDFPCVPGLEAYKRNGLYGSSNLATRLSLARKLNHTMPEGWGVG